MRVFVSGVLAACFTAAVSSPTHARPVPASFTGTVMTGEGRDARPVRHAKATLNGGALRFPRIAETGSSGKYTFNGVPPGNYKIRIEKPGFVTTEFDAAPKLVATLVRGGAIEGTVTDDTADPVSNLAVTVFRSDTDGAKPTRVASTRTDDLGRYRLHSLAAGDYVVEVATDRGFLGRLFLGPGQKPPEIKSVYYPAASTIEDAKPVRVSPGRDTSGVDVAFTAVRPVRDPAAPPRPPRPDATGTGRIAGTVTDAASGKPIRSARLLLLPAAGQGPRITNWTATDAQGRFEYTALTAQRYTLRCEAPGFVALEYGRKRPGEAGVEIRLREGEDFRADVKLPRASAVEGTLLDEFGDPAPRVLVQMARRAYAAGRTRLIPTQMSTAPTDDRGMYRISNVQPGEYYVVALPGVYAGADEFGGFAPTYYPGMPDADAAAPIAVELGADKFGLTFSLAPAKTFSVTGTMVDADGKPVGGHGTLTLGTPDRLRSLNFNIARAETASDGTFVLRNVPQGTYTLQGFAPPRADYRGPMNLGAMPFGWLPVSIGDADLEGVVLKTTNGTSLSGRIVFEDTTVPPPKPEQVRVSTIPIEFDSAPLAGGPSPSQTHADWTFEVTRQSGQRRIFVDTQTPDWMLRKITLDGRDITDKPVDLRTSNVEDVEVVLTSRVSALAGSVSDDRSPVADYAVIVFPTDPSKWIDRSRFVFVARPDQDGRFVLRGVPSEDYLAIALPAVAGSEYMDPAFLQQLRAQATPFTLNDGDSKTLALSLKKKP